jgi:hypothetical protein
MTATLVHTFLVIHVKKRCETKRYVAAVVSFGSGIVSFRVTSGAHTTNSGFERKKRKSFRFAPLLYVHGLP